MVRVSAGKRNFSTLQNDETNSDHRTASNLMATGIFISEVGRPGSEFDDSPPPSAEVKNKWSYTFPPSIRLHVVGREYFKFYFASPHQVTPNKFLNSVVLMQFI
jgi:hypothetical protein